jgi:hypothetical protein
MAPSVSTSISALSALATLSTLGRCASPDLPQSTIALTMATPQLSSKRASTRFSTYSQAPSVANTVKTSLTSESAQQEIKDIEDGLDKLNDKKLSNQRFVLSTERSDNLNKLALGAKLERALDRRMGGQDAVMRVHKKGAASSNEKFLRDPEKSAVA